MPGFEWIDKKELKIVQKIFNDGGTLIAHGFDTQDEDSRTRNLYFMQHAPEFTNDKEHRLWGLYPYLCSFNGTDPDPDAVDPFLKYIKHT